MKVSFAIACFVLVGVVTASDEWLSYKSKHEKVYGSEQEDAMRMSLYIHRQKFIEQHNGQNSVSFRVGHNNFSDWTESELKSLNGFRASGRKQNSPRAKRFLSRLLGNNAPIPAEIDWRKVPGRVTEVKNQGACGSCWAFSTTGLLEGQEANRKNISADSLASLSEQNLVDCSKENYGCGGGNMMDALNFIHKKGGIDDEQSYPYEARDGRCRFKKDKVVFNDKGGAYLPEGDEEGLKKVVAKYGPVSVGIDASLDSFDFYSSGVHYNQECGSDIEDLGHAVLVVGYGTDPAEGDYWIVKNSWGTSYGENGYIKMARNRQNNCGIATAATIAIF